MKQLSYKQHNLALRIYLILGAMFIASLVASNLIFQKFFYWYPFGKVEIFGTRLFELSVGLLPYPITFLITDLISEIYGKKKANLIVIAGIFASLFSLFIIKVGDAAPAVNWSPVDNGKYTLVFGNASLAVLASMIAYLFAQFIDIHVYHWWKKRTNGRMLWVRNNFSTMTSQLVDTVSVIGLLCIFEILKWEQFAGLVIAGFIFKVLVAAIDTPLLYLGVYIFRKVFNLEIGEEIALTPHEKSL